MSDDRRELDFTVSELVTNRANVVKFCYLWTYENPKIRKQVKRSNGKELLSERPQGKGVVDEKVLIEIQALSR
jgi:hypothetical protein